MFFRKKGGTFELRKVAITGLYGHMNLELNLHNDKLIDIIYGDNGTGKTTFLKIMYYLFRAYNVKYMALLAKMDFQKIHLGVFLNFFACVGHLMKVLMGGFVENLGVKSIIWGQNSKLGGKLMLHAPNFGRYLLKVLIELFILEAQN